MRNETALEKEIRIFELYKNDLKRLGGEEKQIRMICIEYECSFPKINPYKMAAALTSEGFKIVFDDSSISERENRQKQKEVKKLIA